VKVVDQDYRDSRGGDDGEGEGGKGEEEGEDEGGWEDCDDDDDDDDEDHDDEDEDVIKKVDAKFTKKIVENDKKVEVNVEKYVEVNDNDRNKNEDIAIDEITADLRDTDIASQSTRPPSLSRYVMYL
jgi:hypothetical protein